MRPFERPTGPVAARPTPLGAARRLWRGTRALLLAAGVAHEVTHSMVARRLGRLRYHLLELWQQEGYADHVAKAGEFDFEATLRAFSSGAPELDPARSGLYLRYHLLVAYALGPLGLSPEALLASPRDSDSLEAALRELGR